jgi:hypothetical protein
VDSPTGTTSPPDCPQDTANRYFRAPQVSARSGNPLATGSGPVPRRPACEATGMACAGCLWTFHEPDVGLRLTRRFGAAPGVEVKYPCYQRICLGESHSQMEEFQAEDRHNPLPHIGPYTTALN